jgi:hypothetical protein
MTSAVKKSVDVKHHLSPSQKGYVGVVALAAFVAAILVSIPPLGQLMRVMH